LDDINKKSGLCTGKAQKDGMPRKGEFMNKIETKRGGVNIKVGINLRG